MEFDMKYLLVFLGALVVIGIAYTLTSSGQELTNSQMLAMEPKYGVVTYGVKYFGNTTGYLARPDAQGSYPGIVMMHEWWGLNDNIRQMARSLASQGYVVLAVDLYDGNVTDNATVAAALSGSVSQSRVLNNMEAAVMYLRTVEDVPKVGSLGWCFGGGESLRLMTSGEKLDASVVYYGAPLITNQTLLARIRWPVMGVFGTNDQVIPLATIYEFNATINRLGITNEVYLYPGLGHAFANPSGATYAPAQTRDAWGKTVDFFDRYLKARP